MRFIELFAGIGGFRYGLEKAFCNKDRGTLSREKREHKQNNVYTKSKHQAICVFANEWDKYACQVYRKNFGKGELYEGDITKVPAKSIPDFDFLTAGFPCQRFSIAGKREGMSGEDTEGSEFYEVYRVAKQKHPKLLLLENVPGLFSSRGGQDFLTILRSLDEIGYDVEWDCVNTSVFLPQNRLRVFIVGHLRGTSGQKVFPIGETMRKNNESGKRQTSGCVKAGEGNIQNDNTYIIQDKGQSGEVRIYKNKCPAITSTWGTGGRNTPMIGDYRYDEGLRIRKDNICPTIRQEAKGQDHSKSPLLIEGKSIRRLTPTECERLQGFPDGWTEGISDTQRYKCLGNAVTTNVITEIGKKILRGIKNEKQNRVV